MDGLPSVILRSVLVYVKISGVESSKDLAACSRVSRAWHHAAAPCLYGIIALDIPHLGTFTDCFQPDKYARYVVSLTLRMDSGNSEPDLYREPSGDQAPHPTLSSRLKKLAKVLGKMTMLTSFSFYLPPSIPCFLPRREIIDILDALPTTCVGLELETRGYDRRHQDDEPQETTHICDSIRRLLPQMKYVRIRTAAMCSSMFGLPPTTSIPHDGNDSAAQLVTMPRLRGMIINCGPAIRTCGYDDWFGAREYLVAAQAWWSVTHALEKVVDAGMGDDAGTIEERPWLTKSSGVTITVAAISDRDGNDMRQWQTRIRADMIRKTSWALPIRGIWLEEDIPGSWIIRLPDGKELLGSPSVVAKVAEGEAVNWYDLVGGARLPRRMIDPYADGPDKDLVRGREFSRILELCGGWGNIKGYSPPLRTRQEWQMNNPRKSAMIWRNEDITGETLVKAEERVGKEKYLSLRPILETTPEGWLRGPDGYAVERQPMFVS